MGRYWKAVMAFLAPGATLLIIDSTDGFTWGDLAVAGLTCIVSAAAVYAVPNKPKDV